MNRISIFFDACLCRVSVHFAMRTQRKDIAGMVALRTLTETKIAEAEATRLNHSDADRELIDSVIQDFRSVLDRLNSSITRSEELLQEGAVLIPVLHKRIFTPWRTL